VRSTQPAPQPFSWLNIDGDIINNGVELTLNYKAIDKADMTFDIGFNISFNENKVENMNGVIDTGDIDGQGLTDAFAQRIQSGQPLYAWFIREFTGYDENGFATYTEDVQQFLGGKSPIPKSIMGLSLNATYKNWDASIFLTGQFGHYIYSNTANAYFTAGSIGNARNVTKEVIESGESNYNAPDASTAFLEKGDFIRMQNASVGYNFKFENLKVFKKLYAYVGGQNLFVITDYSGLDPEVNKNKAINGVPSMGIDYTTYPKARAFMLGVTATF
jgi:iron complex outermembrane receptor protein